jgi:hypothetical protein
MKPLSQDSRWPGLNSNRTTEYKSEALPIKSTCSVTRHSVFSQNLWIYIRGTTSITKLRHRFNRATVISSQHTLTSAHSRIGWYSGNVLNLYSGRAWFESQLKYRLSWLRLFMFSLVPPGKYLGNTSIVPWSLPSKSFTNYHSPIIIASNSL